MPAFRFIKPSSPVLAKAPPTGEGWSHEVKFDGWRAQIHKDDSRVGIFTQRGNDVTNRFSSVAKAVRVLSDKKLILDAELVAVGEDGWPSFYALHTRNPVVTAWCFDILRLDGVDLTPVPLGKRRDILSKVVPAELKGPLRLSEPFDDPIALLAIGEAIKLEGVVSKRLGQPYISGINRGWVKVKTTAWRKANRDRWEQFQPKQAER